MGNLWFSKGPILGTSPNGESKQQMGRDTVLKMIEEIMVHGIRGDISGDFA